MTAYTIAAPQRAEIDPVKGSRFIASVAPAADESRAAAFLESVRGELAGATHHCWAWQLRHPFSCRCSDDGEPRGSAGRPLLATLQGRELTDVVLVVTRYYGGTKLGVGGLIRAYTAAAALALARVERAEIRDMRCLVVEHDYELTSLVEAWALREELAVVDRQYGAKVRVTLSVLAERLEAARCSLRDQTSGRAVLLDV